MAETPEDTLPPEGAEAQTAAPEEGANGEGSQTASAPPTLEDLAADLGWKPESEWKGPKDNWTPAADFLRHKVEKGERVYDELKTVKSTVDRISRTTAAITDRAVAEERDRWQAAWDEAVEIGDRDGARTAASQVARLDAERASVSAPDPLADFRQRNPWFEQDQDAQALAAVIGNRLLQQGVTGEDQILKVEAELKKRFPEHFEGQTQQPQQRQQARAPMVNVSQTRTSQTAPRVKGPADLPAEARKAGEDFVRRGRVKDLAEYARFYFEENA